MRPVLLSLALASLAAAQPVRVDLETVVADPVGFGRAAVEADGAAALTWRGRPEPLAVTVTDGAVLHEGVEAPFEAVTETVSRARFEAEGLGTVEVRAFAGRPGFVLFALADQRRGVLEVGGERVPVALRRPSLSAGFGAESPLGLDLDGDGAYREAAVAEAGRLRTREVAPAGRGRRVGPATLEVDSVAADGSALWARVTDRAVGLGPGFEAPDAALVRLGGDSLRVADLRGRAVVLSWWATTCPYCAEERPLLNETAAAYADDPGVVWLAVAMDGRSAVERFLEAAPYTPEVVLMTPEAEGAFEGNVFPRHTVIAPDGRIVFDESGARDGRGADLHAALAAALGRPGP